MRTGSAAVLAAALSVMGCASTSAQRPFKDVAQNVETRSGHKVRWDQDTEADKEAQQAVDRLLSQELAVDTAVQVALLNSPSLRARFEELAIAQADLVQAGLLKNPVFSIGRTAWDAEHLHTNIFATVEQDFLDIITMPLRKRVAATELEATKLQVADHVLELAAEVREGFYMAQAAEQNAGMRRVISDAAQASADLAKLQHGAGNMNDLDLASELAQTSQTVVERRRSEGEAAVAREKLNKLMGTWGPRTAWTMGARLPELPASEPPLDHLESSAIAQRLDVAAARREVQALGYALDMAKATRWTGSISVHVEAGRLRDSKRFAFGPAVAFEVPLFDQRQAAIARIEAYKRQSENTLHALAVDVRSDVRASRLRVLTARAVTEDYRNVVVPMRENVVKQAQQHYDVMLLSVYHLLQVKQLEIDAYRGYIEALRDYWIARSDLERAIGGRLDAARPASPGTSTVAPAAHGH